MPPVARYAPIALLGLTLLALVAPPGVADVEHDQEKIALDWIAAHNAADVAAMAEFRAKHFRHSEVTEWQAGYRQVVEEFGRLEVYGVMIEGPGRLAIGVNPENREGPIHLMFEFRDDAPDQLLKIGIGDIAGEPGGGPGDDDLPPIELARGWKRRTAQLDDYLRELAAEGLFSGAVLIAGRGEVHYEGAFGLASREFDVPNNVDTRFDVGSCNKDYTRIAILQLAAQRKLTLDDTVGKHLPDYPNEDVRKRVTLRHLIDHRSGLGDYFTDEWWETPMGNLRHVEDYIPIWGPKPLLAEPGERESYSNFGYTVLGAVTEAVSGQRYPDYVVEHIFKPAGMTRSGFFDTDAVVPNVAMGYTHMAPNGRREQAIKNIYLEPAKGGPWGKSYSTVRDLYRFYDAMMNGRVLAGKANWLAGAWDSGNFALGGAGPGLNALVSVEDGLMVVVMANMDPPIAERLALKLSRAARQ